MNINDITAIIPVRLGSERVKEKNIREFAGSSLLDIKIQQLQSINGLKVVVSCSDLKVKEIVSKYHGVDFYLRDPFLSQSDTPLKDLYKSFTLAVKTPWILSTTAMCPLADSSTYKACISQMISADTSMYDCLITYTALKQFIFDDYNNPKNFNFWDGMPRSQDLPNWKYPNFVCNIISTDFVKKNSTTFGKNPMWFNISQEESVDIDTYFDFNVAELLYRQKNFV